MSATSVTMTPEARRLLSSTIRGLRERLLADLHDATESAYRLAVRARDAGLDEAHRARRARLEAWLDEQVRAQEEQLPAAKASKPSKKTAKKKASQKKPKRATEVRTREDFLRDAVKQAAYTLLNRLVILRLMEAAKLRSPAVVMGGFESSSYRDFRQLAPDLVRQLEGVDDATEGYALLLQLVFEDLATELPGIYGSAGIADLIPTPASTLRHVVDALDEEGLSSCWTDDMTLGWIYQYWNDPERESLDDKLNAGGKVEPHEIASKTQMFTERYMVDWLLQNSLGPMWLATCKRHGWTPSCESDGTLAALEERRQDWRAKRERGEVELTALMPLHSEVEQRWAYYVPQPLPDDAVEHAPESIREVKILDPAVGSGHFLVAAFDLLFALYREEAAHRGEEDHDRWSARVVVECILENNLHGIDLDPRAVQIAAAALWIKARQVAPDAEPRHLNLVASNLRLGGLPDDDPALVELRNEVERETGLPARLTDQVIDALRGADHLGSLLKVDAAVDEAIRSHEHVLSTRVAMQGDLYAGFGAEKREPIPAERARAGIVQRLEAFLSSHGRQDDLGLRLRGQQLAAGIRFLRLMNEGQYDLVVGNPPYQGTSKMADSSYVEAHYPKGKADLFAAFLERGLQLVRRGGASALLTMRNWMFIKQYRGLREWLLETYELQALHDISSGGFEEISAAQVVVSVVSSVFRNARGGARTVALRSFDDDTLTQVGETQRKRAATLCQVGRHEFEASALKVVPEWPLVYWWDEELLRAYGRGTLQDVSPTKKGLITSDNGRFVRLPWEPGPSNDRSSDVESASWAPLMSGAKGRNWIEPLSELIRWEHHGLEVKALNEFKYGSYTRQIMNEAVYFQTGIAFTCIGAEFGARVHRYDSVISSTGCSIYPSREHFAAMVCLMNSSTARDVLSSLNPTIHFTNGDVDRLPLFSVARADEVMKVLNEAFTLHESRREPSVEFRQPGSSPWRLAQEWAQQAVDRPEGAPLPEYVEQLDPEPPTDHLSFALGVALGRFGSPDSGSEGILVPATADLSHALPAGILFLDTTLDVEDKRDSFGHPATVPLHEAWEAHGPGIGTKRSLREWLAVDFFKDVHKGMYENRPIHWPLSSEKKTFVAWVNIHRFDERTLRVLLADHLHPTLQRIEGDLTDLRASRDGADKAAARDAEKRYDEVLKARDELTTFIADVEQCADRGPLPPDAKCPPREQDARYAPDLDDGVMINSAALWKLLEPQWKDPKKWWKQLAVASPKGNKDYDWSHLAMRYWPTRVDAKCKDDPSLGVAHGCFWRYHPARAWAWELRLQDEIGPDFRIEEAPYDPPGLKDGPTGDTGDAAHREAYLRDHPDEALEAVKKEALRRRGRGKDAVVVSEMTLLEPGLWSSRPEACWALELEIIEKQKAGFYLRAPDEPEARAAFEAANPEKVTDRRDLMAKVAPQELDFAPEEARG